MKRTFFILLLCTVSLISSAQHMKFLGIPLDGTITNFTTKLQAKGFFIDPDNNKLDSGCRMFQGHFYGKTATIYIYYDATTKIVYRGKALIEDSDYDRLKNLYDEISSSIDGKYLGRHKEDTYKGYPSVSYQIDLQTSADYYEGNIDLFFTDNGLTYYKLFYLHVDYYDGANLQKHEHSIKDDI